MWSCEDWSACENIEQSLKKGIIFGENYRSLIGNCSREGWSNNTCGFQTRNCIDIFKCDPLEDTKEEIQACFYTPKPTCFDGIKNCHNGACELLIDCGGPCIPCPTCSDGIKNQGEELIDCGGPCPICQIETPFYGKVTSFTILMYLVLILFVIIVILVIINYLTKKGAIKEILDKYRETNI